MTKTLQSKLNYLRASVTDGRARHIRYRQNELQNLHSALCSSSTELIDAIKSDSLSSDALKGVAEQEFFLALDSIRQAYDSLDFNHSIKQEYNVKNGEDNSTRTVDFGLVVLRPGQWSHFYSVVTPLAAAIAAGNCVLLELEDCSSFIKPILENVLTTALNRHTFVISRTRLTTQELSQTDLLIDQTEASLTYRYRTIAVVDRTANLQLAAAALVRARLSGSSPYAPSLVIVHEAVGEAFGIACLKYANSLPPPATRKNPKYEDSSRITEHEHFKTVLEKAKVEGKAKVHAFGPTDLKVVEILDRSHTLATLKVPDPHFLLFLVPCTSLVDAVSSQRSLTPSLATYIFADLAAAKFLSESIDSFASYVNHVPVELLVGPSTIPHTLHPRYTPAMFLQARPQFVKVFSSLPKGGVDLVTEALVPLSPTKQPPGHAVGFFEQGIFIGLGAVVLGIFPSAGYMVWCGARWGMAIWKGV